MKKASVKEANLRETLRTLLESRANSKRMLIVSLIEEADNTKEIYKEMLKIQRDISFTIGKYFKDESIPQKHIKELMDQESYTNRKLSPEEKTLVTRYTAGTTLRVMLDHRIQHLVNYVIALKNHDMTTMNTASGDYHNNNTSIASFLSGLSESWAEENIENLLGELELTIRTHISALLAEDDNAAGDACEKAIKISLKIADALADGIIKETTQPKTKTEEEP